MGRTGRSPTISEFNLFTFSTRFGLITSSFRPPLPNKRFEKIWIGLWRYDKDTCRPRRPTVELREMTWDGDPMVSGL